MEDSDGGGSQGKVLGIVICSWKIEDGCCIDRWLASVTNGAKCHSGALGTGHWVPRQPGQPVGGLTGTGPGLLPPALEFGTCQVPARGSGSIGGVLCYARASPDSPREGYTSKFVYRVMAQ